MDFNIIHNLSTGVKDLFLYLLVLLVGFLVVLIWKSLTKQYKDLHMLVNSTIIAQQNLVASFNSCQIESEKIRARTEIRMADLGRIDIALQGCASKADVKRLEILVNEGFERINTVSNQLFEVMLTKPNRGE